MDVRSIILHVQNFPFILLDVRKHNPNKKGIFNIVDGMWKFKKFLRSSSQHKKIATLPLNKSYYDFRGYIPFKSFGNQNAMVMQN